VDRTTLTNSGQIDPARQVITELQEEVGINAAAVKSPRLVGFSEDPLHHSFELVWELETPLDPAAILGAHAALAHREHVEITFVRWADLEAFLAHGPDAVALRSRHLLGHLFPQKKHV
jgi:8-oxo-dGTP pyrophosphatase MutT (NUDIX family)